MSAPIFAPQSAGSKSQQYLHRARMFRSAALGMPNYVNGEQNWPAYALILHACELSLKAFCERAGEAGKQIARAPNHDLQKWYENALQCGLPADERVAKSIDILAEMHKEHYARYPHDRNMVAPELSIIANDTVDWIISAVS